MIVLRRRPPGGRRVRGELARRPPAPGQAHRPVRRQPDPARRADGLGVQRGRARAVRRLRLAHPAGRGRHRRRGDRRRPSTPPRPTSGRRSSRSGPTSATARPNKQDTQKAHGAPLGPDEVRLTKEAYGWDPDKTFYVPGRGARAVPPRGRPGQGAGRRAGSRGSTPMPRRSRPRPRSCKRRLAGRLPDGWDAGLPAYETGTEVATRNASQDTIQALAGPVPELFGGSADLSESNLTDVKANGPTTSRPTTPGRNLRFGVREHGMGVDRERHRLPRRLPALLRDVPDLQRLHARVRPARGPVRPPRDLRLDPRLGRPGRGRADAPAGRALRGAPRDPEPVVRAPGRRQRGGRGLGARGRAARRSRARLSGPVALAFTRQKLPTLRGHAGAWPARACGAAATCCARPRAATPQLILIGTGSELQLAFAAAERSRPTASRRAS